MTPTALVWWAHAATYPSCPSHSPKTQAIDRKGSSPKLTKNKIFSKLDLKSGYWQVPMTPADLGQSAFCHRGRSWRMASHAVRTKKGSWHLSADRQHRSNDFLFKFVHLDDLLVFSSSDQKRRFHVEIIFQKLSQAGITLSQNKFQFFQSQVQFLGHVHFTQNNSSNSQSRRSCQTLPRPSDQRNDKGFCLFRVISKNTVVIVLWLLPQSLTIFVKTQHTLGTWCHFSSTSQFLENLSCVRHAHSRFAAKLKRRAWSRSHSISSRIAPGWQNHKKIY